MRWAAGIAAVAAVAMVVAGCSKNGATQSNQQAQKKEKQVEKKAASLPGSDMVKATRDQTKDGGVLNLSIENLPANFNPAEADANEVGIVPYQQSTLPQFVSSDEAGSAVANPNFTKSFKIISQNPFQVEYVLNPKAAMFFIALFPLAVNVATPKLVQAGYGLWMTLATMGWFCFVSLVFTKPEVRRRFLHYGHWIDRALGIVFLGFALSLALASLK